MSGLDPAEWGRCDTCDAAYELGSRNGRCGDCGNCRTCCTHPIKLEVSVVVEIERADPFFTDAMAVFEASRLLTARAEGFDDPNVVIHVNEVP